MVVVLVVATALRLVMMNRSRDFTRVNSTLEALWLLAHQAVHRALATPVAPQAHRAHCVLDWGSRPPLLPALAAQVLADCATAKFSEHLGSATSATAVMVVVLVVAAALRRFSGLAPPHRRLSLAGLLGPPAVVSQQIPHIRHPLVVAAVLRRNCGRVPTLRFWLRLNAPALRRGRRLAIPDSAAVPLCRLAAIILWHGLNRTTWRIWGVGHEPHGCDNTLLTLKNYLFNYTIKYKIN